MAGALKEKELAQQLYAALQAASCPLVDGLYLQEADSMLQLFCPPSQHRTEILAWICSSISPSFANSKAMAMRSKEPDALNKEMAMLGQELMLCKAGDMDLIKGETNPYRQLQFLEQLLTLVPGCKTSCGHKMDEEMLLNELYSAENLPHLTEMLNPTFDPWPAHMKALHKGAKLYSKQTQNEATDIASLLQSTQSALMELQSECEFLSNEAQSAAIFSPSSLRVAAGDLQQLMATFSHVYETDLRSYCSRDHPSFSSDSNVFQRVHQLLLACNTELEMLNELSEASVYMNEEVNKLQTEPRYWCRGEKRPLPDQLEALIRRSKELLTLLHI
ncbi:HAUS augmin-like complex subunit 7 [Betta splendens]|uniref:HAUS augmin-like complex subunit 7 n=1 Tax=Betta splendens TaxID=158456 RepID=A0A6P7N5L3_BETSP|nr:HAUS augmin-like complex subunit 7 [Betta splendens]